MSSAKRNEFLDFGQSEESDNDTGYDSEAAEVSKAGRASKRRKIDRASKYSDDEADADAVTAPAAAQSTSPTTTLRQPADDDDDRRPSAAKPKGERETTTTSEAATATLQQPAKSKKKKDKKETVPGVIYMSSVPPYLKPSALRNLLEQRGFSPIKRLFLSPASKHKSGSKKNSRRLYTEGWIEFESKKTARLCAEALNAQVVGGRKGGFYHDDVWNLKYLKGMRWEELMAGIREEKREEEGRRDEERRIIARETKRFIEGVEEGRRKEGIKRKRELKGAASGSGHDNDADVKRTWRQVEVRGKNMPQGKDNISEDVKEVLGKIF
ncbi:Pre-rRNA-processing protein esf2 [Exophiala dermatitidis]